jgi:hypothetical protein
MRPVSLQRFRAALRYPGKPIVPDDPASVLHMAGPVGDADSRVPSAHPCGFPPDVPGSDVSLTSSCARTPPAAEHSPVRPFEPGVPVPATRVCAAWPASFRAGSAPGIQPFAAFLRPDSSASVFRRGGPRVVSRAHPPRWFWSRHRPSELQSNSNTADQDASVSTSGLSPVRPAIRCLL